MFTGRLGSSNSRLGLIVLGDLVTVVVVSGPGIFSQLVVTPFGNLFD